MASGMYDNGWAAFHGGDIDWVNTPVSAILIDLNSYTPDLGADASLADIPEAALLAEVLLTGKVINGTILRADDPVFPSVTTAAGVTVGAWVIAKDADTYAGATLLFYFDDAPELPITPDGTDITIAWNANGIYRKTAP